MYLIIKKEKIMILNIKSSVLSSFGLLEDDLNHSDIIKPHLSKLSEIAQKVVDQLKDGFQWHDIMSLGVIIPDVMKIASEIEITGAEKRNFVIEAVWIIYHSIDTGPDGKANRINLPLVFGSLEERIEKAIFKIATEFAINAAYPYLKEKGEV